MTISQESAATPQNPTRAEESKRRLLDALCRGLPAAGEVLRQRRSAEDHTDSDEIRRTRQEEAVQDMRKRLASMPEPSSSPMMSLSPSRLAHSKPADACEVAKHSNIDVESSSSASRVTARLQFLDALEKGFRNFEAPLKNTPSHAGIPVDGAWSEDALQSPMEAASSVLGPDFFASLNALQERMALRKMNNVSQSQSCPDVIASSPTTCEPLQSSQDTGDISSRSSSSSECSQACERTPRDDTSSEVVYTVKNFENADEEGFQSNTEELLRWAEEVLQRAQMENQSERQSYVSPLRVPSTLADRSNNNCQPRHQNSHDRSDAQQRAENWKDEVNRLHQESESELERLASESSRRQQHDRDDEWRRRVTSAAEEMRDNISRWSFDQEGQCRQEWRRSASLPRPQRPCAPPCAPSAPRSFRKAFYTQNAQVATTEVRWVQLEAQLETDSSQPIRFIDIPWPIEGSSLTDVEPGDEAIVVKRKLAHALRRWHPDKWRRILDRVPESEHARVMERVKTIAQRLLEEKARLSGLCGVVR